MALRINPKLGNRARKMRSDLTAPEQMLWRHLKNSQLEGFKFRRQTVIEPYICDFFCPLKGLVVEVDGETHDPQVDARRDRELARRGFATLRFTNAEVMRHMDGVLALIAEKLRNLPDRFTHPLTPSLEREGER